MMDTTITETRDGKNYNRNGLELVPCSLCGKLTTDGPQLTGDALTTDCKGAKPWTSQS